MFMQANFVDIHSQGMCDRSMQSGKELAWEIKLTDWSMAGNLSNRSSGVQIPRDICTHLKVHLTPNFFLSRDETVQHSHKEFDNLTVSDIF